MWNGSDNSFGGGPPPGGPSSGGPSSGGPPPGGPGGPPPGGGDHQPGHYLPGERIKDIDDTFAELDEMADRKAIKAVEEGKIKPEDKKEYYIEQLRKILREAGKEIAEENGDKKVTDVEHYSRLYGKTRDYITRVKRNNK